MKKLLTFILCFLLLFSVVRVANNKDALTLKVFVNTLSTFEFDVTLFTDALKEATEFAELNQPATFPDIASNFANLKDITDFFEALGDMFADIGDCIILIGEWIIFLVKMLVVAVVIPLYKLIVSILDMIFDVLTIFLSLLGYTSVA